MSHVRVRVGLLEPKHVAAMGGGSPLTLYLWLHTRVRFKGDGAGTTFPQQPYRHQDAADALGVPYGTVRRWLRALLRGGYVTTRSLELSNGLELSITKYECTPVQKRTPLTDEGRPKMDRGVSTDGQGGVQKWPPPTVARAIQESTREIHTPLQGETPPALTPKPRGNPKVSAVVDALRAEGMTGTITPRDAKAIRETEHDAREVAALYAAVFRGEYGDPWMQTKLSVALCLEYLPGWRSHQAGHHAPAKRNGQAPRAPSGAAAVRAVFRKAKDDAAAAGIERGRGGDGVGAGEAGPGVPPLLRN